MTHYDAIAQSLIVCANLLRYAKPVEKPLVLMWVAELEDIPVEFIKPAFAEWRKKNPDWPTPSEIRTQARWLIADHEYANRPALEIVVPELPAHNDEPVTEETKSYVRGLLDKWAARHTMTKVEPMVTTVPAPVSGPQDTDTKALAEAAKARLKNA